jgi:hypothetical protein
VGGLRRLAPEEREEWRRHGAPQAPAPEQLQALEAAAEEEWSDDEELDLGEEGLGGGGLWGAGWQGRAPREGAGEQAENWSGGKPSATFPASWSFCARADVELAAELEDELEELAAPAAHPAPAAEAEAAPAVGGAAQQAVAAAILDMEPAGGEEAEEAEEAGFAPAAPPREPIALHLGHGGVAGAAAPQQGGLPVVLAAALPPGAASPQAHP